jgi:dynein heavy chain 1
MVIDHLIISAGFPYACEEVPKPPNYRDAVVNAMVYVHQTLHRLNERLTRRAQRTMAITPRHYLDFIKHFTRLYTEKRQELEQQQLHLNNGLGKIKETETQVAEMQSTLKEKEAELSKKNDLANAKLKQMLDDQKMAVNEKQKSEELQKQLEIQMKQVHEKTAMVQRELAEVEPAVEDARQGLKIFVFGILLPMCL